MNKYGVGIGPCTLERQTIIVFICNVACSVHSNPEAVCNFYYILLAAIGAVSGVFAYFSPPGEQATFGLKSHFTIICIFMLFNGEFVLLHSLI